MRNEGRAKDGYYPYPTPKYLVDRVKAYMDLPLPEYMGSPTSGEGYTLVFLNPPYSRSTLSPQVKGVPDDEK